MDGLRGDGEAAGSLSTRDPLTEEGDGLQAAFFEGGGIPVFVVPTSQAGRICELHYN